MTQTLQDVNSNDSLVITKIANNKWNYLKNANNCQKSPLEDRFKIVIRNSNHANLVGVTLSGYNIER